MLLHGYSGKKMFLNFSHRMQGLPDHGSIPQGTTHQNYDRQTGAFIVSGGQRQPGCPHRSQSRTRSRSMSQAARSWAAIPIRPPPRAPAPKPGGNTHCSGLPHLSWITPGSPSQQSRSCQNSPRFRLSSSPRPSSRGGYRIRASHPMPARGIRGRNTARS